MRRSGHGVKAVPQKAYAINCRMCDNQPPGGEVSGAAAGRAEDEGGTGTGKCGGSMLMLIF